MSSPRKLKSVVNLLSRWCSFEVRIDDALQMSGLTPCAWRRKPLFRVASQLRPVGKAQHRLKAGRGSDGTYLDLLALRTSSNWSMDYPSSKHVGSHCELRTPRRYHLLRRILYMQALLLMFRRYDCMEASSSFFTRVVV
jgi:hypothetical protein